MSGRRRKAGLLGPQVEGYRAWLTRRGYTPATIRNMLDDLGRVGLWSSACGAGSGGARRGWDGGVPRGPARPAIGGSWGRARWCRCWAICGKPASSPAAEPPLTPLGALLGEYRVWLVQERGLAATTVLRYENTARRFLQEQASPVAC